MRCCTFSGFRSVLLGVAFVASMLLAVLPVSAGYLVLDLSYDGTIYDYVRLEDYNAYYVLYSDLPEDPFIDPDVNVRLKSADGSVVYEDVLTVPFIADYVPGISRFEVVRSSGEVLLEADISFCDGDGVCEPCLGTGCGSAENFLTCADCPSGSYDNFCDLRQDSICDPDCRYIDGDCETCNSFCFFDDDTDFTCEALSGTVCGSKEDCYGGRFIYSEDAPESCCLRGVCRNLGEYVETMAEMQTMPYLTVTPSGAMGADIYDYGGPDHYCVYGLEGRICPEGSVCVGDVEEHVFGHFCCHGDCIDILDAGTDVSYDWPVEPLTSEEIEVLMAEEERIDDSYLVDYSKEDYFDAVADDYNDAAEQNRIELEEDIVGELQEIASQEREDQFLQYLPSSVRGFSMPLVTVGVLSLLLLLLVLIMVFKRSADKKVESAPAVTRFPQGVQSATAVPDLQQSIDSLVAKGYSYEQVSAMLIKQGHSSQYVRSEIMRNYRSRGGNS
jgi:hypothetical protein